MPDICFSLFTIYCLLPLLLSLFEFPEEAARADERFSLDALVFVDDELAALDSRCSDLPALCAGADEASLLCGAEVLSERCVSLVGAALSVRSTGTEDSRLPCGAV